MQYKFLQFGAALLMKVATTACDINVILSMLTFSGSASNLATNERSHSENINTSYYGAKFIGN